MKKSHGLQPFSELVAAILLRAIALHMRDFMAKFVRIHGICKDFAGNRVNGLVNVHPISSHISYNNPTKHKKVQGKSMKFNIYSEIHMICDCSFTLL